MSLISWNCRGLGGTRTVRELLGIVAQQRPLFVFLIETKACSDRVEEVRVQLGFEGAFCVDRVGFGGGLALFWRDANVASLLSYSINHIDMEVTIPGTSAWRFTCFYGEPDRSQRQVTWDLLRRLKDQSALPWLVAGDFNDIACLSEKRGVHSHPATLIEGFNDVLGNCQLHDLGMMGGNFTWVKGRGTNAWVEERLGRAVATTDWLELYDHAQVHNIYMRSSDHCAIAVDVETRPVRAALRAFKFESAWLLEEGCAKVVDEAWRMSIGQDFQERLAVCGARIWKWGGEHYRHFGARIRTLRRTLSRLKEDRTSDGVEEFRAAEVELDALSQAEELYWKQRSKQLWLTQGDANTKYFHKAATIRHRRNTLTRIKNQTGDWVEGSDLHAEILRYYDTIFCSEHSTSAIFASVSQTVTAEMNACLLQPFTIIDVKAALFDMAPEKAPGPDGLSPAFFQHFWPVIGHDLAVFVIGCVENKDFPRGLNESNIVLIPKKKIPERVADLRPIALCNVVYKVLAKMLANRLKSCLGQVVSQSQSAFVPERLLTDNIIVASEIGHYLRRKTRGVMGWAALKLDMAKAYDRMEWSFLEGMLGALGFDRGWSDLIMLCVQTVNYAVLVNGEVVGQVCPSWGICQGDPLSPYLFILCAEGLSILLQQAKARGEIHGVRVARGAPAIPHLFFADDSLLFFRATQQEALRIKGCLDLYCLASGQLINYEKSVAVFSLNMTPQVRDEVSECLGVHVAHDLGRYLGLPSVLGRNKTAIFKYIEENIRTRMGLWTHKFLSRAGKEVLLKSIAQALPIFTMSSFLLPLRVCDTLEKLFNRFWWGGGGTGSRGIHWLSWSRMCEPKSEGGLGFKRLHEFNLALLAKQGWRLLIHPTSLVSRLLKAKYYPTSDFMGAHLGNNPSFIWRSIMAGQQVLRLGLARRIGDGMDTTIWGWNWLADSTNTPLHTPSTEYLQEARVGGLMDNQGRWDREVIRDLFVAEDVHRILATPVNILHKDVWRWVGDSKGRYTVRLGYQLLTNSTMQHDAYGDFRAWKKLWALPIPPTVKNFLWRCARDILPVRENLRRKRVWIGGGCPMCNHEAETAQHLFCECVFASTVWEAVDVLQGRQLLSFMDHTIGNSPTLTAVKLAAVFWTIWKCRNDVVWNAKVVSTLEAINRARQSQVIWASAYSKAPRATRVAENAGVWVPPADGTLKCNIDAAIFAEGASFGAVIRDHTGGFVAAKSGWLGGVNDPFLAEVIAAKEALTWLKDQDRANYVLESDCLNFCNAFNSSNVDFSYVGLIIKQCLSIANDMGTVKVVHIKRTVNRVAHELARATVSESVSGVWESIPPACIVHLFSH
ncbi:PREDICTED: uncharacterized protein LOC109174248 [Ipomoea nil]|uniref:uncharacterized protein LOC109174248 n=1 Tax=Ipomoea nil TaxID=35883 RepID=UPI000901BA65|nr:PREDICTED: uncharacterized protein LOC109174248 [Ipomoea nil]